MRLQEILNGGPHQPWVLALLLLGGFEGFLSLQGQLNQVIQERIRVLEGLIPEGVLIWVVHIE
jgi:hypothetical protein